MAWRKDMTPEQREKYNASKRRSYARRRILQGKPYMPTKTNWKPTEEQLRTWRIEEYLRRIGCL